MKSLANFVFALLFICGKAFGISKTLYCEANLQPNGPSTAFNKAALVIAKQDLNSVNLAVEHQGYSFQVIWNFSLTTLYMTIEKNGERLAFSTARVPDENHNDSMLDIGSSPRIWLSCDFVEYRPKS